MQAKSSHFIAAPSQTIWTTIADTQQLLQLFNIDASVDGSIIIAKMGGRALELSEVTKTAQQPKKLVKDYLSDMVDFRITVNIIEQEQGSELDVAVELLQANTFVKMALSRQESRLQHELETGLSQLTQAITGSS